MGEKFRVWCWKAFLYKCSVHFCMWFFLRFYNFLVSVFLCFNVLVFFVLPVFESERANGGDRQTQRAGESGERKWVGFSFSRYSRPFLPLFELAYFLCWISFGFSIFLFFIFLSMISFFCVLCMCGKLVVFDAHTRNVFFFSCLFCGCCGFFVGILRFFWARFSRLCVWRKEATLQMTISLGCCVTHTQYGDDLVILHVFCFVIFDGFLTFCLHAVTHKRDHVRLARLFSLPHKCVCPSGTHPPRFHSPKHSHTHTRTHNCTPK